MNADDEDARGWRTITDDTAYAEPFGTIRKCRLCGCLVAGGPTACARCAADQPFGPVVRHAALSELRQAVEAYLSPERMRLPLYDSIHGELRANIIRYAIELIDATSDRKRDR